MRQRYHLMSLILLLCLPLLFVAVPKTHSSPHFVLAGPCVYLPLLGYTSSSTNANDIAPPNAQGATGNANCAGGPAPAPDVPTPTAISTSTPDPSIPTATTDPAPEPGTPTAVAAPAELSGSIRLLPQYATTVSGVRTPRYIVVFDASGSMSANFDGQCNNSGGVRQCANGPPGAPAVQVSGTGPNYYWTTQSERRIYVAKQALMRLVRRTNMPGNEGYNASRPDAQIAVVWFNAGAPQSNALGFSNNPTSINAFINNANRYGGDAYRSTGGTNGAAGLYRAALLLEAAPRSVNFAGQTYTYENHIIFLTDGVMNYFLDKSRPDLADGTSGPATYPMGSACYKLGNSVIENALCQTTDVGGLYNGWDRPITQLVGVSNIYFHSGIYGPTDVYVVALAYVPQIGLYPGVASAEKTFFSAQTLQRYPDDTTNVDRFIDTVAITQVSSCLPARANSWISNIDAAHMPEGVPALGEARLTNISTGLKFITPIERDPASGQLSYHFAAVPGGDYQLQASLYYKGDDGKTHRYTLTDTTDALVTALPVSLNGQSQVLDISLRLIGDVCAAQ